MSYKLIDWPIIFFDWLEKMWEGRLRPKLISVSLIAIFFIGLIIAFIKDNDLPSLSTGNFFLAIYLSFTLLLLFEVLGLIFILPKSVADSVGKQFEILSIILLRSAFKEFGSYDQPITWQNDWYNPLYHMLSDGFGALVIFLLIGLYYKLQRHTQITENDQEQSEFINFKKLIALFLLGAFIYIGVMDVFHIFRFGSYNPSFNSFYTVLIFCDVLILLYALRYNYRYRNLFRYSSYVLATILIRLSLSAPPYVNVALGVADGLFIIGLTWAYNYFREHTSDQMKLKN